MHSKKEKHTNREQFLSKLLALPNAYIWLIFVVITFIGLYLRFYNIEAVTSFGWDQARDAWIVRDIINGKLTLIGPRTGVGHMHLGPLYFYLLAPFYFFTNFDPMASNYFNILSNIFNFVAIFYVAKKVFGKYSALFIILLYATSSYLININLVPWNVTTMPGVAALIFYSIVKIYEGNLRWVFVMWALTGFYFNLHFTMIFIPVINILSLLFVKNKRKVLWYSFLSIPLFVIWFLPNIIHAVLTGGGDTGLINNFFKDYYIGFHLRFVFHRLVTDALLMFDRILHYPIFLPLTYILPAIFALVALFEKDKKKQLLGYLIGLWFIVPWLGFSIYGGQISEYYFLYNAPMVLFVFAYLQQKLLNIKFLPFFILLFLFWSVYIYQNTKDLWVKPTYGGLLAQKEEVRKAIANGEVLEYNEGDIKTYLYEIWVKDKK